MDQLCSPVGKENLRPVHHDLDARPSHLSTLRCSFASRKQPSGGPGDFLQPRPTNMVELEVTAQEEKVEPVSCARSTSTELQMSSPQQILSPDPAYQSPPLQQQMASMVLAQHSEQKAVRRLSKRLSITHAPANFGGFIADGAHYKLFRSDADHSRPFLMKASTYDKLYDYQREGVKWLWERYCADSGGLLGDDMGLGKTIQVITFLDGLFHAQRVRYALIVLPVSLFETWSVEFTKWAPRLLVERLHDKSVDGRRRMLRQLKTYGGICLTSYGLITSSVDVFQEAGIDWDYVILDEGHKIKNPSIQLSRNIRKLEARFRVILSGTPIQNNLTELWALFDFICKGRLLGSRTEFKELLADKISRGNERCASQYDKIRGEEMARTLQDLIRPYFLRREKSAVLHLPAPGDRHPGNPVMATAPLLDAVKYDFVIWLKLSPTQLNMYKRLLGTTFFAKALASDDQKSSFTVFQALSLLKLVCDHPWLLLKDEDLESALHQVKWRGIEDEESAKVEVPLLRRTNRAGDDGDEVEAREAGAFACSMVTDCVKLAFTCQLLRLLHCQGHRLLVFSHSLKMLNIIQLWLRCMNLRFSRIDGTVKGAAERQHIVDKFNTDPSIFCCLLTTQVGGIGLTLVGADRVLIVDPDWNPSVDNQAVDRAYRIRQTKDVVVYRLVTCGTLEEKIYRHQVFKQGLAMNALGTESIYRHFTRKDLKEMFELGVTNVSQTADQLYALNRDKMKYPAAIEAHMMELRQIKGTANFSDHNLVFDKKEDVGTCVEAQREAANSRRLLNGSKSDASLDLRPSKKRGRPVNSGDSPSQHAKAARAPKGGKSGTSARKEHQPKPSALRDLGLSPYRQPPAKERSPPPQSLTPPHTQMQWRVAMDLDEQDPCHSACSPATPLPVHSAPVQSLPPTMPPDAPATISQQSSFEQATPVGPDADHSVPSPADTLSRSDLIAANSLPPMTLRECSPAVVGDTVDSPACSRRLSTDLDQAMVDEECREPSPLSPSRPPAPISSSASAPTSPDLRTPSWSLGALSPPHCNAAPGEPPQAGELELQCRPSSCSPTTETFPKRLASVSDGPALPERDEDDEVFTNRVPLTTEFTDSSQGTLADNLLSPVDSNVANSPSPSLRASVQCVAEVVNEPHSPSETSAQALQMIDNSEAEGTLPDNLLGSPVDSNVVNSLSPSLRASTRGPSPFSEAISGGDRQPVCSNQCAAKATSEPPSPTETSTRALQMIDDSEAEDGGVATRLDFDEDEVLDSVKRLSGMFLGTQHPLSCQPLDEAESDLGLDDDMEGM